MKTIAIILGSLIATVISAALPDLSVSTVRSATGQFVVRGPALSVIGTNANPALIELDPNILAVTCERIKQALLRELTLLDSWRGRIYVEVNSVLATNQAPIIVGKPYLDGWQYQMEMPRWIEKSKLMRAVVQVLLLEYANRNAGLRSAEIPLWLSEGLSQHLLNSSEVDLALPQPQWNFNRVNVALQTRQGVRRDPLQSARERLQTHAALTFTKMGDVLPDPVPEETWKTFQASAQLFVSELLFVRGGRATLVEMLYELPSYLNWQSAFLNAFRVQFPRMLDVEKWWAVVLVNFTGQDPTQAWTIPVTLQKLDETLHPPVLLAAARKDLPQRAKLSVQRLINEWDYLRQRIVLKGVASQLLVLRIKTPPELISLVDEYRSTLESYLARRDKEGAARALPGVPPTRAELIVRETVRKFDELDAKRAANTPPVAVSTRPTK